MKTLVYLLLPLIFLEIISDKSSLLKTPVYELRQKCLKAISHCLQTKNQKLVVLAANAFQRLLRDELYHTCDSNDSTEQLPFQICETIASYIKIQNECGQVELLQVLIEMCCTIPSQLTSENLQSIITTCVEVDSSSSAIQTAALAAASQACQSYVKYVVNDNLEDEEEVFKEEIFPLISWLCSKINSCLNDSGNTNYASEMSVFLKCVYSILLPIPKNSTIIDQMFVDFIW